MPMSKHRILRLQRVQEDRRSLCNTGYMTALCPYHAGLRAAVLSQSEAQRWDQAVDEWEIVDCEEDPHHEASCVCGQADLRYLFTIANAYNGNTLFPIGSVCINRFGRQDLTEQASIREQLFRLLHAIEDGRFISLDTDYFSRKLLMFLYEDGAFEPNKFNGFDPAVDYQFMLSMFNMRHEPTDAQARKMRALMVTSIKPYLRRIRHQRPAR